MQTQTSTHAQAIGQETVANPSILLGGSVDEPIPLKGTQDRLLRLPEILQDYLPISRSTFYYLVKIGEIDPPIKITERASCWWESNILAYIAKQEARS